MVLVGVCLIACGCDSTPATPTGTLTGTIKHHGKAVPADHRIVIEAPGIVYTAPVEADGKFRFALPSGELEPMEVGTYRVAVTGPALSELTEEEKLRFDTTGRMPERYEKQEKAGVPAQFTSTSTTPVRLELSEGANEKNIEF